MRVFMTKPAARFARKERITAAALLRAAADIVAGRIDADLGGGVVKQRVARAGAGKSGGYRTVVVFRAGSHVFFVYGFAKSSRANISGSELWKRSAGLRTACSPSALPRLRRRSRRVS
jgi:hypothetical protein